jgi:hypothetical protein
MKHLNAKDITEQDLISMGFTNVMGNIYQIKIKDKYLKVIKNYDGISILNK